MCRICQVAIILLYVPISKINKITWLSPLHFSHLQLSPRTYLFSPDPLRGLLANLPAHLLYSASPLHLILSFCMGKCSSPFQYHFWPSILLSQSLSFHVFTTTVPKTLLCAFCLPFFNVFLLIHDLINSFKNPTVTINWTFTSWGHEVPPNCHVQFDLSEIFDTVDHSYLLETLHICLLWHTSSFCISAYVSGRVMEGNRWYT